MKTHETSTKPPASVESDAYRTVVQDLTELVCRFLPDSRYTFVNDVFCRFFGKRREELIGHPWQMVALEEDLPSIQAKLATLNASNPVVVIDGRVLDAVGRVRSMQFINRGFFDSENRLLETQSVGRDVTESVLVEQRLQESNERWKFALESSGFGVWDWDVAGDQIFHSRQFKEILGYAEHDVMEGGANGWQNLVHPDDLSGTLIEVMKVLAGQIEMYSRETRMLCKKGGWKWVMARGKVVRRDSGGVALRMIGTIADISKRKTAEAREAHSLQLIAEGASSTAVLEAITLNVEASYPGMRCSIMLADPAGARLKIKTAPNLPDVVTKAIDGMPIAPDSGCCGAAACSGMRVISADMLADARMEPFFKLALKAGIRACWSEPIVSSMGKVLGTLACYHSQPHEPSQPEIQAVVTAARLAALAIEREWKEQALQISEERYARALRGTTDGLSRDWNITTGDVYLSPRWKQMLGFAENELPNNREESFLARLHPEDVPRVRAARQEHFAHRAPYQVEVRLMTKEGDYRWFLIRGQADWNETDEPVRMSGTISDIEARKRAEQALEESEQRFRAVFELAAVGIAVIETSTGRYLEVNQRMCEINHRTREEMLRLTFMDVTHPHDLRGDLDQMEEMKAGKISGFQMEKRNVAPDGTITWINLSVAPMWRPGEPPLRHIAVVKDITERKLAEFNYRRELDYNLALVNHAAAIIVVMDTKGRFTHCNTAFFSTLGYLENEIIGKTAWETGMMDAREIERSKQRFFRLLRGENNPPADVRLRTKDGEWRTVELRGTSTRKPDGSADRIIITGTDMTERNRLQREVLRVVEQEQARVGHDLHDGVGQSMTGIVIMMEALEAQLNGEAREQARRIYQLMTESVAEVRRMSHGLSPASVKYRGLDGALNLLAETVRTNFRTPCVCELEAGICIGSEDKEAHLFRIAQEAVNNALRHGSPGSILISLKSVSGSECELRVEDDGKGIKKSAKGQTRGIGLRVMDYRAHLIGGRLKVEKNKAKRGVAVICLFECEHSRAADMSKPAKKSASRKRGA